MTACSHVWIDPAEPPIERAPYSPVLGEGLREMKVGRRYVCRNCGAVIDASPNSKINARIFTWK